MVYNNAHPSTLFDDDLEAFNLALSQPKATPQKNNTSFFGCRASASLETETHQFNLIPCISLKPTYIALYNRIDGDISKRPTSNKNSGLISSKSAKRLKNAIGLLYVASKSKKIYSKSKGSYYSFKVNFLTLTLPSAQIHTDTEIHNKIFLPFIRTCRKKFLGFIYLYKVEVQDNGNLHYHLNTNSYIPYAWLRNKWNYYCEKLGYISRCPTNNPNSTDVKAVLKYTDLAKYLSSYISKKDIYKKPLKRWFRRYKKAIALHKEFTHLPKRYFQMMKRKPTIKLWDCSEILKKSIPSHEMPSDKIYSELSKMSEVCEVVKLDYVKLIFTPYYTKEFPSLCELWRTSISHLVDYAKHQQLSFHEN